MGKAIQLSSAKNINTLETPFYVAHPKSSSPNIIKLITATKKNDGPLIAKRASKVRRRVVTIPAASTGRWAGKWTCEYLISLKDLQLHDLAEDGRKGTEVFVTLSLHKIDTGIRVWVLPHDEDDSSTLPEIGGDDPSVIYVKPGCEADLDSLIQDTIRLQIAVKETCSEACENSEPKLHYIGDQMTASLDQRWSRLLHLRKAISDKI